MHTSLLNLQAELEKARQKLKGVEESIKKNIGRDINAAPIIRPGFKRGPRQLDDDGGGGGLDMGGGGKEMRRMGQTGGFTGWGGGLQSQQTGRMQLFNSSGQQQRLINRNNNFRGRLNEDKTEERIPVKRRLGEQPQAITVFSRLSGPPKDEDVEEDPGVKMTSQVIVQDAPSRKEVLAALSGDNQCKERNKRMFGALLGTLQKFRQEENKLKEKEDKRAQVEKKLEEAAQREKEEAKRTRQELFLNRRQQQMEIKRLEYKLLRLKQLSEWESTKVPLKNFIQTKAMPKIFFLPKTHNTKSEELLAISRAAINKMIEMKRAEVEKAIEEHMPDMVGGRQPQNRRTTREQKAGGGDKDEEMVRPRTNKEGTPPPPLGSGGKKFEVTKKKRSTEEGDQSSKPKKDNNIIIKCEGDSGKDKLSTRKASGESDKIHGVKDGPSEQERNGNNGEVRREDEEDKEEGETRTSDEESSEEGEIISPKHKMKQDSSGGGEDEDAASNSEQPGSCKEEQQK